MKSNVQIAKGKVKKYWWVALSVMVLLLFFCGVPKPPVISAPAKSSAVPDLMREIQTINLINGLYLSKEQTEKLLPILSSAASSEDRLNEIFAETDKDVESILLKMKKELVSGGTPSKETIERFQSIERKVQERRFEHLSKQKKELNSVRGLLTENQKTLIAEYQPCIIPASQQANPERIGQSGNNDFLVKVLEKAREVSESDYPGFRTHFLDGTKKMIMLHNPNADIEKELKRHGDILDRARAMKEVDFEMKKAELAKEFKGDRVGGRKDMKESPRPMMKGEGRGQECNDDREKVELDRKIEAFLLNRYACSYLKSKSAER